MRSGGLTKYAISLMTVQSQLGHEVLAIWPGNRFPLLKKMKVRQMKPYGKCHCYEIKNALPLPLFHGIRNTASFFTSELDGYDCFNKFFSENGIEILHVHTMMGMPLAFLIAAEKNGVKIVYTSHDYFGLCPRVNFVNSFGDVCEGPSSEKCLCCNRNAKSAWFLWIRNSWLLVILKKFFKR